MNALLKTKLYTPSLRPNVVTRPRLLQRMNEGLRPANSLTLVSAPAGYGKSLLVSEWLVKSGASTAPPVKSSWLSLDEQDNDPARFLAYMVAALRKFDANIGTSLHSLLSGAQLPPVETLVTSLINDIAEAGQTTTPDPGQEECPPASLVLVLDDYHKVSSPWIHEAIQFLVDYRPPHFHLVLITREDPPLHLAKMRVSGEITEVRLHDLRFAAAEAAEYFSQVMQLDLAPQWVELLEARTEGWIAGLQLAALSLQGRTDVENFVEDFRGSHRYVIDYLMDEVLGRQTEDVRQFLYQTSILPRFCAPLCEAVTGRQDGEQILHRIEQSNLFLISLDERREWYRYHQLFSDFLRMSLEEAQLASLHLKAAAWFEANEQIPEAVEHSLAGQDYARAAHLIENTASHLIGRGELSTVLHWINKLPAEIVSSQVNLLSHKASCLYFTGHIEAALRMIADLDEAAAAKMDALNQGRLVSLKAWTANALEKEETIPLAQQALELIGEDDLLFRAITLIPLGHGHRRKGDMERAADAYREASQLGRRSGNPLVEVNSLNSLALILNEQARRPEALALGEAALQGLVDRRGRLLPVADLLCVSLAVLAYEANELNRAVELALKAAAASQQLLSSRVMGGEVERVLVRAYAAQGDFEAAEKVIREVRQQGAHLRWILPQIDALEAGLQILRGDLEPANRWAESAMGSTVSSSISTRELSHFTLARLLLVQGQLEEAKRLLDRLEGQVRSSGQMARLITILVLQSIAEQGRADLSAALVPLEQAIRLAAPGRYLRRFLDEGETVGALVDEFRRLHQSTLAPEIDAFVEQLAAAFSLEPPDAVPDAAAPALPVARPQPSMPEPLSEQELKVLRLLSAGLSNQEIAAELVISLGTAKWHVHNIYGKLGVSSRTQAVARAQDLHIV